VIVDAVTARWAGALYGLAQRKGALSAVVQDVLRIAAAVERPEVRRLLFNPRLSLEARRAAIAPALQGAHELTRNFVDLAFDRGREEILRGVGLAFHRRTLEENNQVEGVVETARPLDPAAVQRVSAEIGRALGKQLVLTNRVVPELIGGARVVAGTRMFDGSVQGRLEALRRNLLQAPLPA
jgi:F-type H+-transporting ATPase subunit delta